MNAELPPIKSKKTQRHAVWVIAIVQMTAIVGLFIAFGLKWTHEFSEAQVDLDRDSLAFKYIAQSAISDSTRLLDVTAYQLRELSSQNQLNKATALKTLHATRQQFGLHEDTNAFGLLILTDLQGNSIATSDESVFKMYSFSDRDWFKRIVAPPGLRYAIGPLLTARTTGKYVFHLSTPVFGKDNQMVGVLAIQVDAQKITEKLKPLLNCSDNTGEVLTKEHEIILSTTIDSSLLTSKGGVASSIDYEKEIKHSAWSLIGEQLVSIRPLDQLDASIYMRRPVKSIFQQSLNDFFPLIIYGLLSIVLTFSVYFWNYKKMD